VTAPRHDSLHRFLFEHLPVRGQFVHLDASWQAVLERIDYPEPVRDLLGQAMAASVLMASTLKFEGGLTLQIQGEGPVHLLVVHCTSKMQLRGLARWHGDLGDGGLQELVGSGRMAITIEQTGKQERYQGIVPLEGDSFATCLEGYFTRSEQLPTRLWLAADGSAASGLLLQTVPGTEDDGDAFEHASILADTLRDEELQELSVEDILHRLYHEDDVRLFESTPVAFRCSCSRERIQGVLRGMGEEDVRSLVRERGTIDVDCEFCGRHYAFDPVDVEQLFAEDVDAPSPHTLH
jgi:molecular chaperone Hsp33